MPSHILVTGAAGFIGSTLVEKLLEQGYRVTGIDNFDDFYARSLKERNVDSYSHQPFARFVEGDIREKKLYDQLEEETFDAIVHLAAKAGVRPSIQDPEAYQDVNVKGTQTLLEFARKKNITQFIFGSSSSVYGVNGNIPWSEEDHVLKPISPYASTKISGELMGHVYSSLFGIRFIALRFFTVFGPRQRPDLAIHKFSKAIIEGRPVIMYGDGSTRRDYTFVNDIVSGITAALQYDRSMFEVINLGNSQVISLSEMIGTLEDVFDRKAIIEKLPEQPGDVPVTYASIEKAGRLLGYKPVTTFREGLIQFKDWLIQNTPLSK